MRIATLVLLLIHSSFVFSQEKFKIKSIESDAGIYKLSNENLSRLLYGSLDITASYKLNLFTLSNNFGLGFGENENDNTHFEGLYEVDLLYGKEFKLYEKIFLETYSGIGFITQNNTTQNDEKQSLAFPIKLKLLYYTGKKFATGLNPNISFNNVNTIYSLNFIFRLNF
ncbi:MAG: hypothetical protein ACI7YS_13650 [Flavobacterium sp.]